jgi:DNA-binding transcriptional LysR family regulator
MDRLQALSIFKAVVENGSFIGAANSLELSCSGVTRTVQGLEAQLGVRLLHRTTRRIALTSVGHDVLARVAGLLQSYDELEAVGRRSGAEPSGAIRLSAPALFGRHYLGPALAKFRQLCPRVLVGLDLRETSADAVPDGIDLALCLARDLRPNEIARRLAQVVVGIYAAPAYLERRGEPELPVELAEHDCLTSGTGRCSSTWSFTHASGGDRQSIPVRVAMHASQAEVLADAAVHGAGIVMLPAFMAEAAEAQGQLQRLLPGWQLDPMSIHIVYGSRKNQPLAVRRLIEHLVDVLGNAESRTGGRTLSPLQSVDALSEDRPKPAAIVQAQLATKLRVRLAA